MEKERKRELWAEYKAAERVDSLLDELDERLERAPCDHSLRNTLAWAASHQVDADSLRESLRHFGGCCGCEILANVDPDEIF